MNDRTFILVPGFERCGTSWLHDYLSKNKNVNFGHTKEYNFFNSIYLKEYNIFKNINSIKPELKAMYENEDNYFNYFNTILDSEYNFTGDFSPGYSALDEKVLYEIKNKFNKLNIKTKVILLVRNPVDRHISATKMRIKYDHLSLDNNQYNKILIDNITDPIFKINSLYKESYNKLLNVFNNELMLVRYEQLFTYDCINDICKFLNIEYLKPNLSKLVNHTQDVNMEITKETYDILIDYYKSEFNFIKDHS